LLHGLLKISWERLALNQQRIWLPGNSQRNRTSSVSSASLKALIFFCPAHRATKYHAKGIRRGGKTGGQ
jgi:hypothetical protein